MIQNHCLWCGERVNQLSSLVPQESQPMHVECYVRTTLNVEDDPALSKREAAIAAYELYEEQVAVLDRIILDS